MRLLLTSQYFWPENFAINAMVRSLRDRGVEVTVLTGQPNYPDGEVFVGYSAWRIQRDDFEGTEVLRVPTFPRGKRSSIRLALNYISFVIAGIGVGTWLLRGRKFDVVFVYAPSPILQALPAIWSARLKRAPMALWVQDLWPESLSATGYVTNRTALSLVGAVVRFIYRHTDRILIPSRAFHAPIAQMIDDPSKIFYFPNPLVEASSTKSLCEEADCKVQDLPAVGFLSEEIASGFSIVFAGNLGTAQSLETIIGAARILQSQEAPIRFFLIGSGSMSDWLEEQVRNHALLNVRLPGRFPQEAMAGFYSSASALLVSLRADPIFALTIPSKVQGYLAAGKPVIASLDGEGARVVVEAGAGLSCPASDPEALADSALKLYSLSEDARREMGENARRYAYKHFALDTLAIDLVTQLEQLSASKKGKCR